MYRYLFYRLYRFSEAAPSRWWSEWKAAAALTVLEVLVALTVFGFLEVLLSKNLLPVEAVNIYSVSFVLALAGLKYWLFIDDERWKKDAAQFEQLSDQDKWKFNSLFWLVILGVPVCFVLMLCLISTGSS